LCLVLSIAASAQNNTSRGGTQSQQIPDAPSATKPASPFPANTAPAPKTGDRQPAPAASSDENPPAPPAPPTQVKTVPPGGATRTDPDRNSREDFTYRATVNLVVVPVTVKDGSGKLVDGLLKKDFSIYENGVAQRINLFSSDPFPLSVAIVLDSNLPDLTMSKVRETLPALLGAFSEYDEAGVFRYGSTVQEAQDFTASAQQLNVALKQAEKRGRTNGPPVVSGPLTGGPSPTVNNKPFDPSMPHVTVTRRESAVLNDAILAAAQALARRERSRRKVIFVISDGREEGSEASYSDVLKVLLTNDVAVYALAVDAAAIPGYRTLGSIHIPLFGYGNILGKYVSATGGESFAEFTRDSIESAYARVTEQARNQYTLGYTTRETAASDYRSIEVKVHRPALEVHAKDGYYPLPPQR
jgi:VWFA-related protein